MNSLYLLATGCSLIRKIIDLVLNTNDKNTDIYYAEYGDSCH